MLTAPLSTNVLTFLGQTAEVEVAQWVFYGSVVASVATVIVALINGMRIRNLTVTNTTQHSNNATRSEDHLDALEARIGARLSDHEDWRTRIDRRLDSVERGLEGVHQSLMQLSATLLAAFHHPHQLGVPHVEADQGEPGSVGEGGRGRSDADPDDPHHQRGG